MKMYSNSKRKNKTESTGQGKTKFCRQNKILKTATRKFYWQMGKQPIKIKEPLSIKEVEKF